MNNEKIGKYLFTKRKEKGITQAELANILGVTYQAVSRWENGDSIPDIQLLDQLADYYDITIDEILQRKTKVKIMPQEDDTNERNRVMNLLGFILLIGSFLGYGLFYLCSDLAIRYASFWNIIGIISLFMFLIVSNIPINLYYVFEVKKQDDSSRIYTRYYAIFYGFSMSVITFFIVRAGFIYEYDYIILLWYFILVIGLLHKGYINNTLHSLFNGKVSKQSIVPIVLVLLYIFFPHVNTSMQYNIQLAIIPELIIFLYLALK